MVSDFRKKKLTHVFSDFFGNEESGSVDKKNFQAAVEEIAKLKGWSPNEVKYKSAEATLRKIWDGIQSSADGNKDGKITKDEWISMWDTYAKNPSAVPEWQNLYCKFIFEITDTGDDGAIDEDEFATVYASFGLDKNEAIAAFKKMAKGKASVSWGEFQELWKEFFVSEDVNAPGNYIFGKLNF